MAIALFEAVSLKTRCKYVYLHAFAVREDLRRPDLKVGTRFNGAFLELLAFMGYKAVIFTATIGEKSSLPFW